MTKADKLKHQPKTSEEDSKGTTSGCGKGHGGCESDFCMDCGKVVLASHQGLRCDSCGFWHHSLCVNISDEVYTFLQDHSNETSILWICKKCHSQWQSNSTLMAAVLSLEKKMLELSSSMNNRVDKLANLVNDKLDKQDNANMNLIDDNQKRVESKVDQIINTVKQQRTDDMQLHDCVQQAISVKLQEDKDEMEEINKRKTNVIVHGLKEPTASTAEGRQSEDEDQILDMLHQMKCDIISVDSTVRLGKKPDDSQNDKPRPVKIEFASEEQKEKVLRQAKNLRRMRDRGWDRVFIHQDLTPKQREKRHQLVRELKERERNGEDNLLIVNGKIVVRRKREVQEVTSNSSVSTVMPTASLGN